MKLREVRFRDSVRLGQAEHAVLRAGAGVALALVDGWVRVEQGGVTTLVPGANVREATAEPVPVAAPVPLAPLAPLADTGKRGRR